MAREALDDLELNEALTAIGQLVDHANDHADLELVNKVLTWADQLEKRQLSAKQRMLLDYFRANAWAVRQHPRRADLDAAWAWDQEEVKQQIYLLRRAFNTSAIDTLPVLRRCEILTNLANQFDTVGRFIEARMVWGDALRLEPQFWMAQGNRGRALMHYANALYDPNQEGAFALVAHRELTKALQDLDRRPEFGNTGLRSYFVDGADAIARHYDLAAIEEGYPSGDYSLGEGDEERRYRCWCLDQVLFLNPLNDLGPNPIAAQDVLTLPDFISAIGQPPVLIGCFNQLKQEFVSARWLYYEGINSLVPHLSDRHVRLYNTLDYPAFGLGVEKVKIAFRMSYSLLDKVAYFLNRYLQLGVSEKKINFRTIWREKETGPVRPQLDVSRNWPFRGLYWLSKDLFEPDFKELTEPDARALADLRNHLEHKYVKVHPMGAPKPARRGKELDPFFDDFAHSVSRDDLERKTLRLLKLARSALIYLALGMHREERRRRSKADPDVLIASMHLEPWQDDQKGRW
jgi:hypothetical protein